MFVNILYNVVYNANFDKQKFALSHLTHSEGHPYFLFQLPKVFQLPKESTTVFGDYTFSGDHHLSVNKVPIGYNDVSSQYHYTAFFKDKANKEYRLHIYYNSQDMLVSEPLLSRIEGTNFIPVDCTAFYEGFKSLAHSSIHKLVATLRAQQTAQIKALKDEYQQLELQTRELSKDLIKNKTLYLSNINKQIAKLKEISLIANKDPAIVSNISYFERLKRTLELKTEEVQSTGTDNQDLKSKPVVSKQKTKTATKKASAQTASDTVTIDGRVVKKKNDLNTVLREMKNKLNLKSQQLVNEIVNLYANVLCIEYEIDKGIYSATIKEVDELHAIRLRVEDTGNKLLLKLLAAGDYTNAQKLTPFHLSLKDPTLIRYFIKKGDSKLLDFLISFKIIPVDFSNFIIDEKPYNSLVTYYFQKGSSLVSAATAASVASLSANTQLEIINCLDVLIKKGASLMDIDPASGLPYAAILLLNPKHPLRPALERNPELTYDNILFCKQLNEILKLFLTQPACTDVLKVEITKLIAINQLKIDTDLVKRANKPNPGEIALEKQRKDLYNQFKPFYGSTILEQLIADPEIMALEALHSHKIALFFRHLSKDEQKIIIDRDKAVYDEIQKYLSSGDTSGEGRMSFEELKAARIQRVHLLFENLDLNQQILDIRIRFRNGLIKPSQVNATLKQVKNLGAKIDAISEILNAPLKVSSSKKPVNTSNATNMHAFHSATGVSSAGNANAADVASEHSGKDVKSNSI